MKKDSCGFIGRWSYLGIYVTLVMGGCLGAKGAECEPNLGMACHCDNGVIGEKICNLDGTGWSECECKAAEDAGTVATPPVIEGEKCIETGVLICGKDEEETIDNAVLYCAAGTYQRVFQCAEKEPCFTVQGKHSVCCGSKTECLGYALLSAPCVESSGAACSFDRKNVLKCLEGEWKEAIHCPPSECELHLDDDERYIGCANDGYSLGDWCDFVDGGVACSTDLTKVLECSQNRTQVLVDCVGDSKACSLVTVEGKEAIDCI